MIVEVPVRPDYRLIGAAPSETTTNTRRFEVAVAASATEKLPITEERILENSIQVASLTPDVLITYVQNRNLDEASRKKLEPLAQLKQQLASVQNEVQRVDKEIKALFEDQGRLRSNISSLNSVSGQQERVQLYALRLAGQESKLASLRDRKAELEGKQVALEQQIGTMIETLEI